MQPLQLRLHMTLGSPCPPSSFHAIQVFEFQPDPGLQTIQFERPDLVEAVRELGELAA